MGMFYEDDCVGCERCICCGLKKSPHYYCDTCGEEYDPDDLYEDYENEDGDMICKKCILERYNKISVE